MALILSLETSAVNCSASLSQNGNILYSEVDTAGSSHSVKLGIYVDKALKTVEDRGLTLDAVAVSSGPGSYTGLRIGISMAKGISYALQIPLLSIPTLDLLADEVSRLPELPADALIRPMVDARRMEVYTALYDARGNCLNPAEAVIVDETTFAAELQKQPVWFVGDGAEKCRRSILSPNAVFEFRTTPLAASMPPLAEKLYKEEQFVDVAYFEPFYLKDFVTTTSKKPLIPKL
jgi:tRNA threonylcarbamoyladenosine biosynthesis protein TsaB